MRFSAEYNVVCVASLSVPRDRFQAIVCKSVDNFQLRSAIDRHGDRQETDRHTSRLQSKSGRQVYPYRIDGQVFGFVCSVCVSVRVCLCVFMLSQHWFVCTSHRPQWLFVWNDFPFCHTADRFHSIDSAQSAAVFGLCNGNGNVPRSGFDSLPLHDYVSRSAAPAASDALRPNMYSKLYI